MSARVVVGIDLGTTNSAIASAELRGAHAIAFEPVTQLVAAGETAERSTLPSFLYLPGAYELQSEAAALPWVATASGPRAIVGEFARTQGAQIPARLVSSAKSWLCHPRVDRSRAILPWGTDDKEIERISPIDASAAYLTQLAQSWQHRHGTPITDEEIVLCVPASFDQAARELTLTAAHRVGLSPTLLEEPQAAFYAWLSDHEQDWQTQLSPGDTVLVFDVGGGTTDFSLIRVVLDAQGRPALERTAVGDHLLLGGDNMDIALARRVEARISQSQLDARSFVQLVQACRTAKERLLADDDRATWTVTIAGRSSKLIGGSLHAEVTRAEIEELILDGFFPRVAADVSPERARTGLQEFGLPYAADAAITRHLAAFLRVHAALPTAVLWNGGVMKSPAICARVLAVLAGWLGAAPKILHNRAPDLAVAQGAAYYGLTRHGHGLAILSGASRSYYLGVDTQNVQPDSESVLCLLGRGTKPGVELELKEHDLELLTNQPVRFRLFSSAERTDEPGKLLAVPRGTLVVEQPIYTVLKFSRSSKDLTLAVHLLSKLNELGVLELHCIASGTGNESDRWRLEFDIRGTSTSDANDNDAPTFDAEKFAHAQALLRATFSNAGTSPAESVMKQLQAILGAKDSWTTALLRALWGELKELRGGRGKSPVHEARWLNLVGYTLRPGFGYALDDWRCKEIWRLFNAGVVHEKDDPCRLEWWILWRRIAGGLQRTQQDELAKRLMPHFLASFAKRADRKTPPAHEAAEMWRTLASLEQITPQYKAELGEVLLTDLERKKAGDYALWALGRFGTRTPLIGAAELVISPQKAAKWVDRLLALDWTSENFAIATAEIARLCGDRTRDLELPLRHKIADRLRKADVKDGERLAQLVLVVTPRVAKEERFAFGEALPSGLRLTALDQTS